MPYCDIIAYFTEHFKLYLKMAEKVGFEPTVPCGITSFQDTANAHAFAKAPSSLSLPLSYHMGTIRLPVRLQHD